MLRKANEVIGVRQYYGYGELRLSDAPEQVFLARRFLMLRKANEVIGVRQYYECGELRKKYRF